MRIVLPRSARRGALLLLLASSTAACGGTTRPATLTHAALVARANAICQAGNNAVETLPSNLANPQTLPGVAAQARAILQIARPAIAKLAHLMPSKSDAALYHRFVALSETQLADTTAQANAAAAGNVPGWQAASRRSARDNPDPEARALGLSACAFDPSPGSHGVPTQSLPA